MQDRALSVVGLDRFVLLVDDAAAVALTEVLYRCYSEPQSQASGNITVGVCCDNATMPTFDEHTPDEQDQPPMTIGDLFGKPKIPKFRLPEVRIPQPPTVVDYQDYQHVFDDQMEAIEQEWEERAAEKAAQDRIEAERIKRERRMFRMTVVSTVAAVLAVVVGVLSWIFG